MWFEETFCEALAVWALEQLALEWKKAKEPQIKLIAGSFSSYAKSLHYNISQPPEGYPKWFAKNRKYLAENDDRALNNVLAVKFIEYANVDPAFFQSFLYLRKNYPAKVEDSSIEWVLKRWRDNCPDQLKSGPDKVAKLLGIKFL